MTSSGSTPKSGVPATSPLVLSRPSTAKTPNTHPTPAPHLFFAIASSQPEEVSRLLAAGEASANETVGPNDMHALAFAIESMARGDPADLPKREEIVTTLLSYGADPQVVMDQPVTSPEQDPKDEAVNPFVK